MAKAMPAIFFGHGNPMNAVERNAYSKGWADIGKTIDRPNAVLCVSAHWYGPGSFVTAMPSPRTIHDFGGFPEELYQIKYPAPGSPTLARRVKELLAPVSVELDQSWGLDHGTWAVLVHVFPGADIPVIQLSIDATQPPTFHYEMGKRLAVLRERGILVIGSGNIVHNLSMYAWGKSGVQPFDWAMRFEKKIKELLVRGDDAQVVAYKKLGPDAILSVPTPDHYLPLLYVLGLRKAKERISFPVEGIEGGSVSMLAVQIA
jgi:4,5-DOPA dioxygenase extradiol